MTETTEQINAIKIGAALMFETLNAVYALHDVEEFEAEGFDATLAKCAHCSELAKEIVRYPCPTVKLLLEDMVAEEETPAE